MADGEWRVASEYGQRPVSDAGLRRLVRVKALRRTDVFDFEPGPESSKHARTPRALPPPRTTWAKSASRVYSALQSKCPLRAPSAICASGPEGKRWKRLITVRTRPIARAFVVVK